MRYLLRVVAVGLLICLLLPLSALASDVSNAQYLTKVVISNNSTGVGNVAVPFTSNTSAMISGGMLSASASDAAMRSASGDDVPFMPGYGVNPWMTFIDAIGGNTQVTQFLYTKGVTGGKEVYFPGATGMIILDDDSMELGNAFIMEIKGLFNTINTGYVAYKQDAFSIVTASGNVTVNFLTTGDAVVKSVTFNMNTAEHVLRVSAISDSLYLYIDDIETPVASIDLGGVSVPDNNNPWQFAASMIYLEYLKIWK
jgi:hypothetical protein